MEEQKDEVLTKDSSLRVTKEMDFGTSKGQLRVYNNNVTPKEYEEYPKVTITVAEDLKKFQYGIIKITTQESSDSPEYDYLVQVDGLMSIVYATYAKTLNELRKPTFRDKGVRMQNKLWSVLKRLFIQKQK